MSLGPRKHKYMLKSSPVHNIVNTLCNHSRCSETKTPVRPGTPSLGQSLSFRIVRNVAPSPKQVSGLYPASCTRHNPSGLLSRACAARLRNLEKLSCFLARVVVSAPPAHAVRSATHSFTRAHVSRDGASISLGTS